MAQPYDSAEALEQYLGDPAQPGNTFSFQQSMELDEREMYPEAICALLAGWDLHEYYIPHQHGGKLASFEELLALMRVVARRDLTVAVAHGGTLLGAVAVWMAGSAGQQRRLAETIRAGTSVGFGLTERLHGSDLLANETRAIRTGNGYRLSGEKWLIGNATRGSAITVYARTEPDGGPRGFSLFLVEKSRLDRSSYTYLPKITTHGLRGHDLSGICFLDCPIADTTLIGPAGYGLEITLKSLQITRTLVAGLALGAADTALRTTLQFALERKLYGRPIYDLPLTRTMLANAFADLLICDCAAIAAVRSLHTAPDQMSVLSAIVKYYVPATVERLIHSLSIVLGARHYLREAYAWGIFQKLVRDSAILSLFDGSTIVNLQAIGLQLRGLAQNRAQTDQQRSDEMRQRLAALFSLEQAVHDFQWAGLELMNRGRDDIIQGLPASLADLHGLKITADVDPDVVAAIIALAGKVAEQLKTHTDRLAALAGRYGSALNQSAELFELAEQYCALHAAATCIHMWVYNRRALGPFFAQGAWLVLCLSRILVTLHVTVEPLPNRYLDDITNHMVELYRADRLYAMRAFQLAHTEQGAG